MTANHLLDAMGLLDDELIQEAEEYKRGKGKNYGTWLAWAASFAVVLRADPSEHRYERRDRQRWCGWRQPGGQRRPQHLLRRRGCERRHLGRRPVRH